jgi:preprotein translocase subunit YajC
MFASIAYAQNAAPAPGGTLGSMVPLLLMILIFYFLLIRPQMKKSKEHKAMLGALQVGERVATTGGVHGEIKSITPDIIVLQVDDKTKIKVDRVAITRKIVAGQSEA